MNEPYRKSLSWLISILVVIAVVLTAVRLVMNDWYVEFEYQTPNFPADSYGFDQQERLRYSKIAIDYLLNEEGIEFLAEQRFPSGETVPFPSCQYMADCTRMYNERELKHMVDVKNLVQAALVVWYISLAGLVLFGVWAWFGGWWDLYRKAASFGGWLTLIFIVAILALVLLAFGFLFVGFHQIFFAEGTWMFLTSDTLIRLFPERFWRDTFLMVGGLSALMGLAFALLLRSRRPVREISSRPNEIEGL